MVLIFCLNLPVPNLAPRQRERGGGGGGGEERERGRGGRQKTDRQGESKNREKEIARRDQVRWSYLTNSHAHSQLNPTLTQLTTTYQKTLTTKHYYKALLSRWVGRASLSGMDSCALFRKILPNETKLFFLSTYPNNQLTMHTNNKQMKTYFT